jgi:hypothetical protein
MEVNLVGDTQTAIEVKQVVAALQQNMLAVINGECFVVAGVERI